MSELNAKRRELLKRTAATGSAIAAAPFLQESRPVSAAERFTVVTPINVTLRVNGDVHRLALDPRTTLLTPYASIYTWAAPKRAAAWDSAARARC